jgi:nitrate reductase delta subunit
MIGRAGARRAAAARTYKLCSLLLQYPDAELVAARGDLRAAVRELPRSDAATALERFCAWWASAEPLAIEQHYVETFDLHKRSGLYLTFYGEGDRRERGMALLRLKRLYRAAGMPLEGRELPDYLPVVLEFAAATPGGRGDVVLREHRPALELIREGLRERSSPYAHVLDAVCATLGDLSMADRARVARLAAAGPPQELVGLEPFAPPEVMPSTGARR